MQRSLALVKKTNNLKLRAYPKPWSQVEAKFRTTFLECKKIKRGCKWCTEGRPTCCEDFEANQDRLKMWRDEMRRTNTSRHDAEVLIIFGSSFREVSENKSESSTKPKIKPTEDDETSDATQLTSLSPESDRAQEPSLKRTFQQAESESESETEATSLSTQSSLCTSPSPPLHQPKRRKLPGPPPVNSTYRKRLRLGKASRTIDLTNLIFPPGTPKVCRRSSLHFLGLSEQRIHRVCNGIPDGRTRGHRLPNSHPAFAPQLTTCMRFLNYCWHFFCEGLPDKFSIDKGDGCAPESGCLTHLELESDSEDSGEEDERSISALALHIHSAEEAGTEALMGPTGSRRVPCRYIGVIRPVTLFHLLGKWCGARNLTCPGFSTLLRALLDAKSFIKFRKGAGQHANCEVCVFFKKALKRILSLKVRQDTLEAYCRSYVFYNRNMISLALAPFLPPRTLPAPPPPSPPFPP